MLDISTSFGPARALTRAPMCTAIPLMSSLPMSHSTPNNNPNAKAWLAATYEPPF